jgi:hypothetical protein
MFIILISIKFTFQIVKNHLDQNLVRLYQIIIAFKREIHMNFNGFFH